MNKEKTNPLSQQQEKIKRQTFLRQLNQIKHNPQGGEDEDSPPAAPIGQRTGCCWEQQTGSRKAGNVLHEHVIIARRGHVVRVRPTKHKHMSSVIFSFTPLSVFFKQKGITPKTAGQNWDCVPLPVQLSHETLRPASRDTKDPFSLVSTAVCCETLTHSRTGAATNHYL